MVSYSKPRLPATDDKVPTRPLSVQEIATCANPTEQYAVLRGRRMYWEDGDLIVAAPETVAQALAHPALSVVPAGSPEVDPLALRADMARFSDGPEHSRRRKLVQHFLPAATDLAADAEREATAILDKRDGVVDVMPLARTAPVLVLARAIGVGVDDVDRVVYATGELCDALAPTLASATGRPDANPAARVLERLLAATGVDGAEGIAAAAGILFQARDATAALIGAAVLTIDNTGISPKPWEVVDRVLRQDPPVQSTRRFAVEDLTLGGLHVPRGTGVWVVLGAADNGPPTPPATFGAGPHVCPGSAHARALASGVLSALRAGRWNVVDGQRVRYEPRPNLRVPASVLMERT